MPDTQAWKEKNPWPLWGKSYMAWTSKRTHTCTHMKVSFLWKSLPQWCHPLNYAQFGDSQPVHRSQRIWVTTQWGNQHGNKQRVCGFPRDHSVRIWQLAVSPSLCAVTNGAMVKYGLTEMGHANMLVQCNHPWWSLLLMTMMTSGKITFLGQAFFLFIYFSSTKIALLML